MFQNISEETQEPQWSSDGAEHLSEDNDRYLFIDLQALKNKNINKTESQLNNNNNNNTVLNL